MSSDWKDCPFTQEERTWIIFEFGRLQSVIEVRRSFRNYFKKAPYQVPRYNAFFRLVSRFSSTGSCKPKKPQGKTVTKTIKENAEKSKPWWSQNLGYPLERFMLNLIFHKHQYVVYSGSI